MRARKGKKPNQLLRVWWIFNLRVRISAAVFNRYDTERTMDNTPNMPPLDPLQRYSVAESERLLRSSRTIIYEKIRSGEIATIKDGRRRFIPGSEIARLSRV